MEQYLPCYVSYQQVDWAHGLPMAEFAVKNQETSATMATLFFANYAFHPHFNTHLAPVDSSPQAHDAQSFANTIANFHDFLRTQMLSSQDR